VAVTEVDPAEIKKILLAWREEEQRLHEEALSEEDDDRGA
jgi:hypothetical protein